MAVYINRDAPESGIASLLALQGTKGDTELVHMTKPEVKMMMNTGLMSMNNETGLPQFSQGGNILGSLLPMIAGLVFPPLLGPSIGMALGVGSVASSAIAGGMGTALAGMLTGDDPADALTKGLLSGGISYGAGSLFPETFGFDQAAGAGGTGGMPQTSADYASMAEAYSSPADIGSFSASESFSSGMPDQFSYGMDQQVGVADYPAINFRPNVSQQRQPFPGEDRNFDRIINLENKNSFDPQFGMDNTFDIKPIGSGMPQTSADYDLMARGYSSPSKTSPLMGVDTETVTETSWMDRFKDELPGSLGEAGDRLVDPKSGVFSKQAMATGLGTLGAGLLMPEEVEELTVEERPSYVPTERDYVYNRKKPSFIDGLTPSQIRELYEKGGIDRRFYEQPSSGKGVFPVAAQSGGGIEDLIEMSETVGISETPFEGMITGDGHGMEDNVMMPILERGGVAAVSPKEYVVPADVMSMIGNGNADSGAEAMDGFIADFRTAKYGRPTQPPQIDGRSALQSLMKT